MIKKILKKFGYITEIEHKKIVESLITEMAQLQDEKLALRTEVSSLSHLVPREEKQKTVFDISMGDPTPIDSEARKMYVASVSGFFKEIMEPKLKYMISNVHNMFEEVTNDRDFDLVLKGVSYSFREMLKWGEAMINEQVANQIENTNSPDTEDDVQSLQDKINNI